MNNYLTHLSFQKLESFDMHRSSLTSFVLIRNSLISVLTQQQSQQESYYAQQEESSSKERNEGQEQVWLDSCFHQLEDGDEHLSLTDDYEVEDEYDSSDEDDAMPLSPQENSVPFYKKKPTFFIHEEDEEEEDGLICYDIPFLSLTNSTSF